MAIYDARTWENIDPLSPLLIEYMKDEDVKKAIHVSGKPWHLNDETGPVTEALIQDFVSPSIYIVKHLLDSGLRVLLYTGNMDMSCGFRGLENILQELDWNNWKSLERFVWAEPRCDQGVHQVLQE